MLGDATPGAINGIRVTSRCFLAADLVTDGTRLAVVAGAGCNLGNSGLAQLWAGYDLSPASLAGGTLYKPAALALATVNSSRETNGALQIRAGAGATQPAATWWRDRYDPNAARSHWADWIFEYEGQSNAALRAALLADQSDEKVYLREWADQFEANDHANPIRPRRSVALCFPRIARHGVLRGVAAAEATHRPPP